MVFVSGSDDMQEAYFFYMINYKQPYRVSVAQDGRLEI